MISKLSQLASKEMDRKEFLQHAGVGLALVAGSGLIARAVTSLQPGAATQKSVASTASYGGSAYGA